MELETYQVHAFASAPYSGNPAGVCLHGPSLDVDEMRAIAMDLGPSVTAFVEDAAGKRLPLRWFTREGNEVQSFCGHATFAAAHVMLRCRRQALDAIEFETISGVRRVEAAGDELTMQIPCWPAHKAPCPDEVSQAFGAEPSEFLLTGRDALLVFPDEAAVAALQPDFDLLRPLGSMGWIACAQTGPASIGFRFFCPGFDIGEDEDPATGSAFSTLAPHWRQQMAAPVLTARQMSARGAEFEFGLAGDAAFVTGTCATFLTGVITQPGGME